MDNLIDIAIGCVERSWAVFPLLPGKKIPATGHGFKDASKDIALVRMQWAKRPDSNIGIATGLISGIVVVDVDVKKKAKGKTSVKMIKGLLPETYTVSTPSGGWHLYYSTNVPIRSRTGFLPGVDIKADGGYVVGEGSCLSSNENKRYTVTSHVPISNFPDFLREQINANEIKVSTTCVNRQKREHNGVEVAVRPGDWHFPILRQVARMVRRGRSDNEILAEMEAYTLPGYSTDQTRKEVSVMILGARQKGFDR